MNHKSIQFKSVKTQCGNKKEIKEHWKKKQDYFKGTVPPEMCARYYIGTLEHRLSPLPVCER
jgi:hypothetical protein